MPSLQVCSRRAGNIRDTPAVEPLRVPLAGASVNTQTRWSILLVTADTQRGFVRIIAHLPTDLEVSGPFPRRHSGYVYLLERRRRLVLGFRVFLKVHVLIRVLSSLRIAPAKVSTHVRAAGSRQVVTLTASLEAHVLIRVIVDADVGAVLRVAALEHGTSPGTTRRRGPRERHVLVKILLIIGLLRISESVAVAI